MILTPEQLIQLAEVGYDEECDSYYNTVTKSYQEFSSSATVKWPDTSDVLRWFRKKGYKYSIVPAVFSNIVYYEIYAYEGKTRVESWEEAEYEILCKLIDIEYDKRSLEKES
jgi:hypothetical protein